MVESKHEKNKEEIRDEEWADKKFPERGHQLSNEVIVNEDAEPSPNIAHPH